MKEGAFLLPQLFYKMNAGFTLFLQNSDEDFSRIDPIIEKPLFNEYVNRYIYIRNFKKRNAKVQKIKKGSSGYATRYRRAIISLKIRYAQVCPTIPTILNFEQSYSPAAPCGCSTLACSRVPFYQYLFEFTSFIEKILNLKSRIEEYKWYLILI